MCWKVNNLKDWMFASSGEGTNWYWPAIDYQRNICCHLERFRDSIRRKRPELWRTGGWMLHHDNAPADSLLLVRQYLAKNKVTVFPHLPYSPDLAPCDFHLFPKLKLQLNGERFEDIDSIQQNVTRRLRQLSENGFQNCMNKWQHRWNQCISSSRYCFEGTHQ